MYMDDYIENKKQEASEIERDAKQYFCKLHIIGLKPVTPNEYYESLKDRSRPKSYKNPKKSWADKDAGITAGLKFKSLFNADAKKELSMKKEQAAAIHAANIESEKESYDRYVEEFYNRQDSQHREVDKLHNEMKRGNSDEIISYFGYALSIDRYSVDYLNDYAFEANDFSFDKNKGILKFAYRIPAADEILTFKGFYYDEDSDQILPESIDKQHQYIQRIGVMREILIRAVEMIYYSDVYHFVNDLEITGFLSYYDDSFGKERRKNVVRFNMNRQDFFETNFEAVNIKSLFEDRIKPKLSAGLYKKPSKEIKDI